MTEKQVAESTQQSTQRMRPGVKALIVHEGKILVIHENVMRDNKQVVITDFPGGGIEFGENLVEALQREVKEEVGLEIIVEKTVGAWSFVFQDNETDSSIKAGVHIVCIGYQCKLVGDLQINLENNPAQEYIFDAQWYTQAELLDPERNFFQKSPDMLAAVRNLSL